MATRGLQRSRNQASPAAFADCHKPLLPVETVFGESLVVPRCVRDDLMDATRFLGPEFCRIASAKARDPQIMRGEFVGHDRKRLIDQSHGGALQGLLNPTQDLCILKPKEPNGLRESTPNIGLEPALTTAQKIRETQHGILHTRSATWQFELGVIDVWRDQPVKKGRCDGAVGLQVLTHYDVEVCKPIEHIAASQTGAVGNAADHTLVSSAKLDGNLRQGRSLGQTHIGSQTSRGIAHRYRTKRSFGPASTLRAAWPSAVRKSSPSMVKCATGGSSMRSAPPLA